LILWQKDDDHIQIVLWNNGEGFDVSIASDGIQHFELTWGQFKAIKKLVKELDAEGVEAFRPVQSECEDVIRKISEKDRTLLLEKYKDEMQKLEKNIEKNA
jgi:hypothetical protein